MKSVFKINIVISTLLGAYFSEATTLRNSSPFTIQLKTDEAYVEAQILNNSVVSQKLLQNSEDQPFQLELISPEGKLVLETDTRETKKGPQHQPAHNFIDLKPGELSQPEGSTLTIEPTKNWTLNWGPFRYSVVPGAVYRLRVVFRSAISGKTPDLWRGIVKSEEIQFPIPSKVSKTYSWNGESVSLEEFEKREATLGERQDQMHMWLWPNGGSVSYNRKKKDGTKVHFNSGGYPTRMSDSAREEKPTLSEDKIVKQIPQDTNFSSAVLRHPLVVSFEIESIKVIADSKTPKELRIKNKLPGYSSFHLGIKLTHIWKGVLMEAIGEKVEGFPYLYSGPIRSRPAGLWVSVGTENHPQIGENWTLFCSSTSTTPTKLGTLLTGFSENCQVQKEQTKQLANIQTIENQGAHLEFATTLISTLLQSEK